MSESDAIEALSEISLNATTYVSIFISVTFAYLTVAYLVGKQLTRFQCLAVSALYFLIAGMMLLGFLLRNFNEWLGGFVVVGGIYCGIGLALLVSSLNYWKTRSQPEPEPDAG